MKYKQHLADNIAPEYGPEPYLAYGELDDIIRQLSSQAPPSAVDQANRGVSISAPPPTNARGLPVLSVKEISDEDFFSKMDSELVKVENHTLEVASSLRLTLEGVEKELKCANLNDQKCVDRLLAETDAVAEMFLTLEKFVNVNFMGFHKILKKHDKYCPANPCKAFYVSRMNSQAWVRGDYSDITSRIATIYSALRSDTAVEANQNVSQPFPSSTTKYWVKTEDISRVKYAILRHLPVFVQEESTTGDGRLTNSVYLDNDQLELYHDRLFKKPGAIALRLRWYGSGEPNVVFVERRTHMGKYSGETSIRERFMVKEDEVKDVLTGTYPVEAKKQEMLAKGASQQEADEWEMLAAEVCQVLQTKQLIPTVRTQYMQTTFQIPFDSTVRASLDTNLRMISERGYDTQNGRVWHRDPSNIINNTEITTFPHAVLEIKLELKDGNLAPPRWVTELQNSGMLYEVHKFSKNIHGSAVLFNEDVRCVPYWVDDVSVRDSIIASGAGRILADQPTVGNSKLGDAGPSIDAAARASITAQKSQASTKQVNFYDGDLDGGEEIDMDEDGTCCSWVFPFCSNNNAYQVSLAAPPAGGQIEVKVFLANERTYLHWLNAAITLYTIAAGILTFSSKTDQSWAVYYAMGLLPISLGFCIYALRNFLWRANRIKTKIPGRWDDLRGPMVLGGLLVAILSVNFLSKLLVIAKYNSIKSDL